MQSKRFYEFAEFRIDVDQRVLLQNNRPVSLTPKVFDVLLVLVENSGRIVEKDELMSLVWQDTFVEEVNLARNVSDLRKALGDTRSRPRFIETIAKRGYRFIADVRQKEDDALLRDESRVLPFSPQPGAQSDSYPHPRPSGGLVLAPVKTVEEELEAEPEPAPQPLPIEAPDSAPLPVVPRASRNRTAILAITAAAIVIVIAGSAAYFFATRGAAIARRMSSLRDRQRESTAPMKVTRVTNNGRVKSAALSPDGKYVAYILGDALAGDSIHLTEPGTSSDVVVLPPGSASLGAIRFQPDGNDLYFYREKDNEDGYCKMPVLGGPLESILPGIHSSIALSPDGKRVAFLQADPEKRETALMLANTDEGGDPKRLVTLTWPRNFTSNGLAWSPDGKVIAIGCFATHQQQFTSLMTVQVADGTMTPISTWGSIGDLTWLSDGSGLVMVAGDDEMLDASQVWLVPYPDGEARRITNDILRYGSDITLSSGSNQLVVVAAHLATNIWVSPMSDPAQARQITFGTEGRFDGLYGLHWTPDNRIVYGAYVGYAQTIWIMNGDGSNQKQLTPGRKHISDSAVRVSLDGRYILFHSNRSGSAEIWRIDLDGGNPAQITSGGTNYHPATSADTRWVVYRSWADGKGLLWKVPIDGGEPVRLTDKPAGWPGVSPDGRLVACSYSGKLAVIPFEGGEPVKLFDMPATGTLFPAGAVWLPDGSALLYHDTTQGIWKQPLAGGMPEKLSGLRAETAFNLALSADGQKLAITYGTQSSDGVLISNFR